MSPSQRIADCVHTHTKQEWEREWQREREEGKREQKEKKHKHETQTNETCHGYFAFHIRRVCQAGHRQDIPIGNWCRCTVNTRIAAPSSK